jgi:hypothetical protein
MCAEHKGWYLKSTQALCPRNTDKNCNIIAKSRFVKIQAWAWTAYGAYMCAKELKGFGKIKKVPCFIVLKASDLAKIKGDK